MSSPDHHSGQKDGEWFSWLSWNRIIHGDSSTEMIDNFESQPNASDHECEAGSASHIAACIQNL
jgi:hypothetical protein